MISYPFVHMKKLHLYFKIKRGDRRMSGAVGEYVGSAVDACPTSPSSYNDCDRAKRTTAHR